MKWHVYGKVVGTKYLGKVEADTAEEAVRKAEQLNTFSVILCHQCTSEIGDPEIDDLIVEPAE